MKHLTVEAIKQMAPLELEVHAHEGGIYTARCHLNSDETVIVRHQDGRPFTAKSLVEMKDVFKTMGFANVFLVTQTPYDEMIHTDTYREPVRARLHW